MIAILDQIQAVIVHPTTLFLYTFVCVFLIIRR